jgi:hypothetical protein
MRTGPRRQGTDRTGRTIHVRPRARLRRQATTGRGSMTRARCPRGRRPGNGRRNHRRRRGFRWRDPHCRKSGCNGHRGHHVGHRIPEYDPRSQVTHRSSQIINKGRPSLEPVHRGKRQEDFAGFLDEGNDLQVLRGVYLSGPTESGEILLGKRQPGRPRRNWKNKSTK